MVQSSLLSFLAILVLSFSVNAQAQPISATRYQLDSCLAFASENGYSERNIYVAWASGNVHTCRMSESSPESSRSYVVDECEKSLRLAERQFGDLDRCKLVVDGGQIIDSVYKHALSLWEPWPVEITIFDSVSGRPADRRRGTYSDFPIAYSGLVPVKWSFKLHFDEILICEGETTSNRDFSEVSFEVDCFDKVYVGVATPGKILRNDGLLIIVPEAVRITRGDSWIEVDF
jgi:hypothetical protein